MTGEPRVYLDLLGAQESWTADRGIGRFIVQQAGAVLDRAQHAVRGLLLHADGQLGPGVIALSGRAPAVYERDGPPGDDLPNVFHVMSPFAEQPLLRVWPVWARAREVATVVTLYDLIPLRYPERYLIDPKVSHAYRARLELIRRADGVLAISERTAADAVELLGCRPDRITVVGAGASTGLAEMWPSREAAESFVQARWPDVDRPFLFYVGGNEPRKNIEGLFRALAALPPDLGQQLRLVLTCALTPAYRQYLDKQLQLAGVPRERVVLTGHVTDSELAALYRGCTLFVFPSFYEGSGLPLLEAMACDAPVIASRTATGPEILGSTDGTFDPADPSDIAAEIATAVGRPDRLAALRRRSREQAQRFRWADVAARTWQGYGAAAPRRRPRRTRPRRARRRLALVSPAPPERSGIATYTAQLARALAEHVDVEVVVDPARGRHVAVGHARASIVDASGYHMRCELGRYDRTLFCMGNSEFHGHVYDAFVERPDVVLLHDVRITQFFRYYGFVRRGDPGWFGGKLAALYGAAIPADVRAHGDVTREETHRLGIFMTGELQALASRLLVHSRFAAEVVRMDRRGRPAGAPIDVLPLACPPVRPRTGRRTGRHVVSLGYVDEIKGVSALLPAMAQLVRVLPDATLTFIGPTEPGDLERWITTCRGLGLSRSVHFAGFLPDDAYRRELDHADLAVQLRAASNGEASAAVTDCLAAGVPTIVSDLGWLSELPSGTVGRVPVDVPPHQLAASMREVLEDADRRALLSREALEYARQMSFPNVAKRYLELLEL